MHVRETSTAAFCTAIMTRGRMRAREVCRNENFACEESPPRRQIHLDLLVLKERLQTDTHTINRADWLICSRVLETAG